MKKIDLMGSVDSREVYLNGKKLDPKKSQKFINHSPDGFMWGYGGSGPAQLALAILMEYLPKKEADLYHQSFKTDFIAKLDMDADFITTIDLEEWLKDKRNK